ncbi:MAG TPA: helix-turn-helix domain-containing protein [Gammaproteobacteria bacterium]|nr:helix-turn-helix domain-containing protein [Gammaproteobacteria bacterium]
MTKGKRIKFARKRAKLSQLEIAKPCGVDRGTVSQWESGKIKNVAPEHMRIIAKLTRTPLEWLELNIGSPDMDDDEVTYPVPIIEWNEAEQYARKGAPDSAVNRRYIDARLRVGPNAYALTVTGDDNFNAATGEGLVPGSVIVVDPATDTEPGKIVVVHEPGGRTPYAGKLIERGSKRYIQPLNPRIDASLLKKGAAIIGAVRRMFLDRIL